MIRFLTTREHAYTFDSLLAGRLGPREFDCEVLPYDRFVLRRRVPFATYVFCDLERLTPWETRTVSEAYRCLRDAGCPVLNDPARVASRFELLRKLHDEGINDFEVFRADEHRAPSRFPVFLRYEQSHEEPLSDLIPDEEALAGALRGLQRDGVALRGVLIVEFRGEAFEPGVYRKYSTFRIGQAVLTHHIVNQNHWVAKYGDEGVVRPDRLYEFERGFVEENRHSEVVSRAFEIASIEYGRADFSLVNGRVQIYEINTNPFLGSTNPSKMTPFRIETLTKSNRRLLDGFRAIDTARSGTLKLELPSVTALGRRFRWYRHFYRPMPRP